MKITVDLAGLVGAEFISHEHVPGVFIPFTPNCVVSHNASGRHAYVGFKMKKPATLKSYDEGGTQIIPREHFERFLEDPKYSGKRRYVAWLFRGDGSSGEGGVVSSEDFDRIVGEK